MIITCGQCQARFKIAPEQIKETGSKVRCSNCQYVFTVYRPRPVEAPEPAELERVYRRESDPLNSFLDDLDSGSGDRSAAYGDMDDLFDDPPRRRESRREDYDDDYEDDDDGNLGDLLSGSGRQAPDGGLSPQERMARRRQLYSDLEDEPGRSTYDDSLDDEDPLDDDPDYDDENQAPPSVRRTGQPAAGRSAEEKDDDDFSDEDFEDLAEDDDHYYENGQAGSAHPEEDHGLGANPVVDALAEAQLRPKVIIGLDASRETSIRSAVSTQPPKSPFRVVVPLLILILVIGGGAYYFLSRPSATAFSGGDQTSAEPAQPSRSADDPSGAAHIGFPSERENLVHFYRDNGSAGKLLIITGMVTNNYNERRSFIRLKAILNDVNDRILAERSVYAGNIIEESLLTTLPISEIQNRLSIKSGVDGKNMNVEPGAEVPFMIVFDKLPTDVAEYKISPAGSSPGD